MVRADGAADLLEFVYEIVRSDIRKLRRSELEMPFQAKFVALVGAEVEVRLAIFQIFGDSGVPGDGARLLLAERVLGQPPLRFAARLHERYDAHAADGLAYSAWAVRQHEALGAAFAHAYAEAGYGVVPVDAGTGLGRLQGADGDVCQPHNLSRHCLADRSRKSEHACFAAILRLTETSTAPMA